MDDIFERARFAIKQPGNVARIISSRWPDAVLKTGEWWLRNPLRDDAHVGSFSIRDDSGLHFDHATSEGGDLIGLVAHTEGLSLLESAKRILAELGEGLASAARSEKRIDRPKESKKMAAVSILVGAPDEAADPVFHPKSRNGETFVKSWNYHDAAGKRVMAVGRYDGSNGKKTFLVQHWAGKNWQWGKLPGPLPLFDLARIHAVPDAVVIVCEGEKAAVAAQALFPGTVCTTSALGAGNAKSSDWSCLQGREVIIAGDADSSGAGFVRDAATCCLKAGAERIRVVDWPSAIKGWTKPGKTKPGGWDFADPVPDGIDLPRLIEEAGTPDWLGAAPCAEPAEPDHDKSGEAHAAGGDPTRPGLGSFESDASGLYHRVPERLDGASGATIPEKRIRIAGPFQVLAEARDPRNGRWGLLLHWQDGDGVDHELIVPRQMAIGDCIDLAKLFVGRGLWVHPKAAYRKLLGEYLGSVRVEARARSVERIGWHAGSYVLPDEQFSREGNAERMYLDLETDHSFRVSGTLEQWQDSIGVPVRGNSRAVFLISAGLSAALLHPMEVDSGGFHLYGKSSGGKTTLLEVSGSVWGGPKYSNNWNASSSGLEAIAVSHCDAPLLLDEHGQALGKDAGAIVYLLGNGQDRIRSTKTLESAPRRHWRIVLLSTGEVTLGEKVAEDGKAIKAGHDVRLADVPAHPTGRDQVFETWDGFDSSLELAKALKSASRKFYGTACRAFLNHLVVSCDANLDEWRAWKRTWVASVLPPRADSQVERVADRFALAALAGELGLKWGILPWPTGHASWAARICFCDWLRNRGGAQASEELRGVQAVLNFIQAHRLSRFPDWESPDNFMTSNLAGFTRRSAQGLDDYLFHNAGWAEACRGFDPVVVAKAMLREGLLEPIYEGKKNRLVYAKNMRRQGAVERYHIVLGSGIEAYLQREREDPTPDPDSSDLGDSHVGMEVGDGN